MLLIYLKSCVVTNSETKKKDLLINQVELPNKSFLWTSGLVVTNSTTRGSTLTKKLKHDSRDEVAFYFLELLLGFSDLNSQ